MAHVPLGVFMLLLASADAWAGLKLGWLGLPLLWGAASVGLTGLAYAAGRPRWLGKRDDGSVSLPILLVNLPFVIVAHFAMSLRRLSREPVWNEITPTLYLGRRTSKAMLPAEVDLVVDLTAEFAEPAAIRSGTRYRLLPALDGCAPDERELRRLLDEIAGWPGRVYVHCAVGHGRSAMFAAGLLVLRGLAANVAEAEALLKRARPGVNLSRAHRRAVTRALSAG